MITESLLKNAINSGYVLFSAIGSQQQAKHGLGVADLAAVHLCDRCPQRQPVDLDEFMGLRPGRDT